MKKVTRWSPDTCECVIDYEWDDEEPVETREITVKTIIKKCPVHARRGKASCFNEVLSENRRKNQAIGFLQEEIPDLVSQAEGVPPKADTVWHFDKERNLQVHVIGTEIDALAKSRAQSKCDHSFGQGKVHID